MERIVLLKLGMQIILKDAKYGKSNRTSTSYSLMNCSCTHIREEAVNNYRLARENGCDLDNPATEFPRDGSFKWDKANLNKINSKVKIVYHEGTKDAAWMQKKDENFIARLESEMELNETIQPTNTFKI